MRWNSAAFAQRVLRRHEHLQNEFVVQRLLFDSESPGRSKWVWLKMDRTMNSSNPETKHTALHLTGPMQAKQLRRSPIVSSDHAYKATSSYAIADRDQSSTAPPLKSRALAQKSEHPRESSSSNHPRSRQGRKRKNPATIKLRGLNYV